MDRTVYVGIALAAVLAVAFTAASIDTSIDRYDPTPPDSDERPVSSGGCGSSEGSGQCVSDRPGVGGGGSTGSSGGSGGAVGGGAATLWQILASVLLLTLGGVTILYGLTRGDDVEPARQNPDRSSSVQSAGEISSARDVPPTNDVYRAWLALCARASPDDPAASPAAIAATAVAQGYDEHAVQTLCNEFCSVRYGTSEPTKRREKRVRKTATELGLLEGEE